MCRHTNNLMGAVNAALDNKAYSLDQLPRCQARLRLSQHLIRDCRIAFADGVITTDEAQHILGHATFGGEIDRVILRTELADDVTATQLDGHLDGLAKGRAALVGAAHGA
jgi:hypothetical protein